MLDSLSESFRSTLELVYLSHDGVELDMFESVFFVLAVQAHSPLLNFGIIFRSIDLSQFAEMLLEVVVAGDQVEVAFVVVKVFGIHRDQSRKTLSETLCVTFA